VETANKVRREVYNSAQLTQQPGVAALFSSTVGADHFCLERLASHPDHPLLVLLARYSCGQEAVRRLQLVSLRCVLAMDTRLVGTLLLHLAPLHRAVVL
jgi:hypothetical protein